MTSVPAVPVGGVYYKPIEEEEQQEENNFIYQNEPEEEKEVKKYTFRVLPQSSVPSSQQPEPPRKPQHDLPPVVDELPEGFDIGSPIYYKEDEPEVFPPSSSPRRRASQVHNKQQKDPSFFNLDEEDFSWGFGPQTPDIWDMFHASGWGEKTNRRSDNGGAQRRRSEVKEETEEEKVKKTRTRSRRRNPGGNRSPKAVPKPTASAEAQKPSDEQVKRQSRRRKAGRGLESTLSLGQRFQFGDYGF